MPRKAVVSKSEQAVRVRASSRDRKTYAEASRTEPEGHKSETVSSLRPKRKVYEKQIHCLSGGKGSRAPTGKKLLDDTEASKNPGKSSVRTASKVKNVVLVEPKSSNRKSKVEKRPIDRTRVRKERRALRSKDVSDVENAVCQKRNAGKKPILRSREESRPEKKVKTAIPSSSARDALRFKNDSRSKKISKRRKKRVPKSKEATSPERLRALPTADDFWGLSESILDVHNPDEQVAPSNMLGSFDPLQPNTEPLGDVQPEDIDRALATDEFFLRDQHINDSLFPAGSPTQQQLNGTQDLNAGALSTLDFNIMSGSPLVGGRSRIGSRSGANPRGPPKIALWVGVFVSSEDQYIALLDVFNGLHFNIILEAENGGGDAQRFEFTKHKFGKCRLVQISNRLANAFNVVRVGRFFPIDVPVHQSATRDTVYNCSLSFPPNDVTPTNQTGLLFPSNMRFCTRVVKTFSGTEDKTPLTFQPFFPGDYFYHLSATRKVHNICSFIMKGPDIWFPRSFGQEPAEKLTGVGNNLLQYRLENDQLLQICKRTMDPMVPFLRHLRPNFRENTNEKGQFVDGGRPKRDDNLDLLTSRRSCLELLRVQNELMDVPKPRRAYVIVHGDRFPPFLVLKRQEVGDMLNVKPTWLSTHLRECGMPNWAGSSFLTKAGNLRGMLIRLHVAAEFIVSVIAANLDRDQPVVFPNKSLYRIRRIRRKIRAYRRDRRQFIGQYDPTVPVDSGDSMDAIPNDGLEDYLDEAGENVLNPGSDNEFEHPNGVSTRDTSLINTRETYFNEEFLNPWNDLPQRDQDFMLDPMWEAVMPWTNQPLDENQPEIPQGDNWFPMEQSTPRGDLHELPNARSAGQEVTNVHSVLQSFNQYDSETGDSATEGLRAPVNSATRVIPIEENHGNFVLGGERRHAKFVHRRGRGIAYRMGRAQKRKYDTPVPFKSADRLARRIRVDLFEVYGNSITIPPVVVKYEDYNQAG